MMSDFLAHFLTYLPTYVRFCLNTNFQFCFIVSDFRKSTYLPKNRTSFMDVPLSIRNKTQQCILNFDLQTDFLYKILQTAQIWIDKNDAKI